MTSARSGLTTGLASLAMGLLLAGCGSDGDPDTASDSDPQPSESTSASTPTETPTETPSASPSPGVGAPDCKDVWRRDARLPRGYKGCNETTSGATEYVPRFVLECSSGQRLVTYADHYWAVLGGTIHRTESRLVKDAEYGDAIARCRG